MLSIVPPPSSIVPNGDVADVTASFPSPRLHSTAAILRDLGPENLRGLQAATGYPCISIFLPTTPDVVLGQTEQARAEALVQKAMGRLELEMSPEDAASQAAPFAALIACIAGQRSGEALGFFVGPEGRAVYRVAMPVDERVVIDPSFATRDLARMLNLHPPYRLLVLGNATARLYVGIGRRLREVRSPELPIDRRVAAAQQDRKGHRLEAERSTKERQLQGAFVRKVAIAVASHSESAALPLIVMAPAAVASVVRKEPLFEPVAVVSGSHERAAVSRLAELARSGLDEHLLRERERALERLEVAVRQRRSALGVHHVWTSAKRGDIDTLIVDEAFRYPAWTTLGGQSLVRAFTAEMPDVLDDAVDEIVEMVQRVDGSVVFVPAGTLGADHIAAIRLRR